MMLAWHQQRVLTVQQQQQQRGGPLYYIQLTDVNVRYIFPSVVYFPDACKTMVQSLGPAKPSVFLVQAQMAHHYSTTERGGITPSLGCAIIVVMTTGDQQTVSIKEVWCVQEKATQQWQRAAGNTRPVVGQPCMY